MSSMDNYVRAVGADLVVMATRALSARVLGTTAVLGSVTLAAVKRINVPLLIINANSAAAIAKDKGEVKFGDGSYREVIQPQGLYFSHHSGTSLHSSASSTPHLVSLYPVPPPHLSSKAHHGVCGRTEQLPRHG